MKQTVIKTTNLTKKFGNQYALNNINLEIKKGEIYGLIGRNGAGKTTFIRMLTSLFKPTSGTIRLFGQPLSVSNLERTASIIETPVAYDGLSAYDNLKYYCIEQGISDYNIINEVLGFVNLTDTGNKKFKDFSLGMRQRLGIAIAILGNPDFLILDEPINGLDPIAIIEFRELILKLNREYNMTILISSHILTELYHVATRFGIINNGKLIAEISKEEFDLQCQEAVSFKVANPDQALVVLTEKFTYDVKVVNDNEVRIFGVDEEKAADLNIVLIQSGIRVEHMEIIKADLEEYFTKMIAE